MALFLEIRDRLFSCQEEEYRRFNRSLIPGKCCPIIGVRMPALKKMVKEMAPEEIEKYLKEAFVFSTKEELYHEEKILLAICLGTWQEELFPTHPYFQQFLQLIDNWAICDSACTYFKFIGQDKDVWFPFIVGLTNSIAEMIRRFAVVCLQLYFLDQEHIEQVLFVLAQMPQKGYYSNMAIAWTLSAAYFVFPEKIIELFQENRVSSWVQNKAITKIKESKKATAYDRKQLNNLRR